MLQWCLHACTIQQGLPRQLLCEFHSLVQAQHAAKQLAAQAVAALCCVMSVRVAILLLDRVAARSLSIPQVLVGRGFGQSDAATFAGPIEIAALMSGPCEALGRSCRLVSPPEDSWDVRMCVD